MSDKNAGDTQIIETSAPPIHDISGEGQKQGKTQSQVQDIRVKTTTDSLMLATCNPTRTYKRGKEVLQCSSISLKPQTKQQQDAVDTLLALHSNEATYMLLERGSDDLACISFYTGVYKPKP